MPDHDERQYDFVARPNHTLRKAANSQGAAEKLDLFSEIGTSGLRQYGGFIVEEWLRQLQGRRAAWAFREMADNDPVVGAILFAIRTLARGVDWRVEEGNDPAAVEFVEECRDDMSHTWGDFISEALSCLQYGWAYHELVYKRRTGMRPEHRPLDGGQYTQEDDQSDPGTSRFTDGKIGWRKIPVRAQETLLKWHFDGYSGIQAMEQVDWHGGQHIIPIEKALLFRTETTRNNPEGRSILRNAYTSYVRLKNIQTIEAIGIERDLAGIPVLAPPPGVDLWAPANAQLKAAAQQLVTSLRRDEYEGILKPSTEWELELLSSGGSRQIDTDAIIRRYEQRIATSVLADFVLIGQDAVGSFAMVDVKSDLFGVALDAILDLLCEPINRYAIPRLLELNGMDASDPPRICHSSAGRIDLEKVGGFLYQLAGSGAPIPWSLELLESLFLQAGLPTDFDSATPVADMVPVKPPKLEDGSDAFAKEPHLEPADAVPAPQPTAKADVLCPDCGASLPADATTCPECGTTVVFKAERTVTSHGTALDVQPILARRTPILQAHLDNDMRQALDQLGDQAARAYIAAVAARGRIRKAAGPSDAVLARRVLAALTLNKFVGQTLRPIIQRHYQRVLDDTVQTLKAEVGIGTDIPDTLARQILRDGGSKLGLRDIEPQVRQAIVKAIADGRANGDSPLAIASRIRSTVPAGRFTKAGSDYRSQLIARSETMNAQRMSTLAAYRAAPSVTAVMLRDGLLTNSDQECIDRDGDIVSFDVASALAQSEHPNGSLSFDPVVTGDVAGGVVTDVAAEQTSD